MKLLSLVTSLLLASGTTAAAAVEDTDSEARMNAVFGNALVLHVDGGASIPMFFTPDGTVYYAYLYQKLEELKSNYSQTVRWKLQGEELCAVKSAELMTCFILPQMSLGGVADTTVRAVDQNGDVRWHEDAKIMLLAGPSTGRYSGAH